jgi:ATP-dependent DNA helicase DinG
MSLRFTDDAAADLRRAIREAGGVEVFAIGDVAHGEVTAVTITCRGTEDRVPALLDRPRAGQAVVHNHPSGDLRPSEADLQLAHLYGENGVGVVIVDSGVTRSTWVVEPHAPERKRVDPDAVRRFFAEGLPRAMPGWEARPQQVEMALHVAHCLDEEVPLLCEAGTGTGKSLAYLVPAALWALANDGKVAVSTYTKALQAQLVTSDLPMLARGGIDVKSAVLQGRNNYLCKRRMAAALEEEGDPDETRRMLEDLRDWSASAADGQRGDLGFQVDPATWERVMSDADLTLSVRCAHYESCHWYSARRRASAAHLLVVNHALLLSDLAVRHEAGRGFLPKFARVVIDEAHHLEDAGTSVATERLSRAAVERSTWSVLDARARKGALRKVLELGEGRDSPLTAASRKGFLEKVATAEAALSTLRGGAGFSLGALADTFLPTDEPVRVVAATEDAEPWRLEVTPTLLHLASELESSAEALDHVLGAFDDAALAPAHEEPLMVLKRAHRRLSAHATFARSFLEGQDDCRWVEPDRDRRGERAAAACRAPIEVGPVLKRLLWDELPGTALTSATMTVAGRFDHLVQRVGVPREDHTEIVYDSPFDHASQALLALPRDLPSPDDPAFLAETARVVVDAVTLSDGGAFVLCTSHAAVRQYAEALRAGPSSRPVLAQGEAGRPILLERFRDNRRAVLVGTDSFWEGVSVKGEGLRLVIIPRLPFRVPSDPLQAARIDKLAASGADPFRAYTLPEAVLKLRQGYGRLIRSKTDTGVVLLLDRRVHDKWYGQVVLRSLPPARRVTGPWQVVRAAVAERAKLAAR